MVSPGQNKDGKNQDETDEKSVVSEYGKDSLQNSTTAIDSMNVDMDESKTNKKLSASNLDKHDMANASKDNIEALEVALEVIETCVKAIDKVNVGQDSSLEAARSREEENQTQDAETFATERSIDGTDMDDSARGKSTDSTESRTSMLNVGRILSPEKSDKGRPDSEIGKSGFHL